jgi:hypothetical protein
MSLVSGYVSVSFNASSTNHYLALASSVTSPVYYTYEFPNAAGTLALTSQIPTLAGLGGVPTSRTLTINGTAYDLSANRSWTITAGLADGFTTYGTLYARTAMTTYRDHSVSAPDDAPIKSLANTQDNWIYLDSANAQWGIYHRNIDTDLAVAGQPTLLANSIAYIGDNQIASFINLTNGNGYYRGNLGIGIVTTTTKLHIVNNTDGFVARFTGGATSGVLGGFYANSTTGFASIGVQSAHQFRIFTNDADRLIVTSDGKIGIGVNPTQSAALTFADSLAQKILFNNNANNYRIDLASAVAGGDAMMKFIAGSTGAGEVGFYTTTNLRMLICSGGNVLIGGSSDNGTHKLQVTGKIRTTDNILVTAVGEAWGEGVAISVPTTSTWGGFRLRRERGSYEGNWYFGYVGFDSTDDFVWGANNGGTQVDNILRLTKAGNVLMGKAVANGFGSAMSLQINGASGSLLETSYNGTSGLRIGSGSDHSYHHDPRNAEMRFATSDSTRFYIYGNGNYDFTGSDVSDRRAKTNISPLEISATDKIMSLQAKTYNMKNNLSQIRYGFIAQDVKEIVSDLVIGDENDGYIGMDYNGLLTLAIKALQEQQKEIQILKQK